jgi:hypothetical protein
MRARKTRPKRAINGTLELDGARLVWQLASEQGWIPGEGMRGHRISVQLGKASLRAGGKGIHAIAESTVWQRNRPAGEAEMAGK